MFCVFCISLSIAIPSQYAHRAVVENAAVEATYPEHFKNPFYKTPRLRNKCFLSVNDTNYNIFNVLGFETL